MEEFQINRRTGLKALGVAAGAALLGTGLSSVANAAPRALLGAPERPKASTGYSVTIYNESKLMDHYALVYQQLPKMQPSVVTLAWLSQVLNSGANITFDWTIDYNFLWSANGDLAPGTHWRAGQQVDADLEKNNYITLHYNKGAYSFINQGHMDGDGLFIFEDRSVPKVGDPGSGSVGIGMSGHGTFVRPTASNTNLSFSPTPRYYVAFGDFEQSTVLDIEELTQPQEIVFEPGNFHIDATYDGRDWSIKQ